MWRSPWPRRGASARSDNDAIDRAELTALLDQIRRTRLTLSADLSAAAGALDAEQPEVARDIVAADQLEVRRLTAPAVVAPQPQSSRRRRALVALPAIPLVGALAITGAAAITSGGTNHHRTPTAGQAVVASIATPATIQQTAATTLHQLERVVAGHHHQRQVVTVAAHLHHQLTTLIATSPNNAKRLSEVRRLLSVEQQLLESHHGEGTAIALAASRHLNKLLASVGAPSILPTSLPPILVKPTKGATTSPTPKSQSTKTSRPKPSTSPTKVVVTPPTPSHSPTSGRHHRHHHHHLPTPLLGTGLLSSGL